ncbi:hypothetical protein, partial [Borreliella garinii]|uniref:hypothetical protein n=1 Tax=Borreliella garinii TaxID=29519 RepID=UPI001AEDBCFF
NLKIPEIENFALKNFSEEIISLFEKHSAISLIKTYKKDILKQEESADQKSLFKQESTISSLDNLNTIDTENVKYHSITT